MSKFLRTAATVAGAAALVATGIGAIGGAALAAKVGASIGVSLATVSKVATVAAIGASLGAQLTAKRPSQERQGLQLSFKIEPGGPIPIVLGRTATAGTIVHRETEGSENHYQTYFNVLSGAGPVDAIEGFLADREPVSFTGTSALSYYANWMWQDRQLGATPEADALGHGVGSPPFGSIPATVPGWGPDYKLSGYAASSWTLLFDTKGRRYAGGEPQPLWVLRGVKLYDPRKDSTYPGGSGPHRWADPSDPVAHAAARETWEYSATPALASLMWRLGFWHRNPVTGVFHRVAGIGARIDQIDLAAIVEAANVQDANGWSLGGVVDTGMDKWEALKLIEQAGGCEPIAKGAIMSTLVKCPRVPIAVITVRDLGEGSIEAPAMRPRKERVNQFRPRFRSEEHDWEMTDADLVTFPDLIAVDGGERTKGGEYALVQDKQQATELAGYEIWDGRERQPIAVPLKLNFIGARIGDCYTLDIPEAGLIEQDAIVRGRQIDPITIQPTLTFRGETPAKHAAIFALTGNVPPPPPVPGPIERPTIAAAARILVANPQYPATSDETSITIAAFNATLSDGRVNAAFPAGSVTSLTASTFYELLYDEVAGQYLAVPTPALAEVGDPDNVWIARVATLDAGGEAPPQETPPPGWGGYNGSPIP